MLSLRARQRRLAASWRGFADPGDLAATPALASLALLLVLIMIYLGLLAQGVGGDLLLPRLRMGVPYDPRISGLTVAMDENGICCVAGRRLDADELRGVMAAARGTGGPRVVFARVDARAEYRHVAELLAACRVAGVKQVRWSVEVLR